MNALVGYTGFVGSNLYASGAFDAVYNSKNIDAAFGTKPDLLVYAGVRAEKYLANHDPRKDLEQINEARDNIRRIQPEKVVLISTIDVFKVPKDVDETGEIETDGLHAYGYDRYLLEKGVREDFPDALIIRLPGLFGDHLKKNFIYDYIHVIPFMLKEEKFTELSKMDGDLVKYYALQDNGFYKLNCKDEDREILKNKFKKIGFTAMNFTDSRSIYQFYDLSRLWSDIQIALREDIKLLHMATEPVSAGELYRFLSGQEFTNHLAAIPADYGYKTIYAEKFGGSLGYIENKDQVLQRIKQYVEKQF